MINIDKLGQITKPILPTVYEESFSYLEEVAYLRDGVKEVAIQSNDNKAILKKKVSFEDMKEKYKMSDEADFRGSWHGFKNPVASEPGIQNQVNQNVIDIEENKEEIEKLKKIKINVKDYGATGDGVTDDSDIINLCIAKLGWNGGTVYLPKGTYLINKGINLSSYGGVQRHSITLEGESQDGTVLLKNENSTFDEYILMINGYHHTVKNLTVLGTKRTSVHYYAEIGIYVTGYPMPNIDIGCKFLQLDMVKIRRCDVGLQLGNYDKDGKDPDIETNNFKNLAITECNTGVFFNGQNILNNPIVSSHFTDCRDYLIHEKRGSEIKLEYCYLGNIFDYLNSSVPPHANAKILNESGATIIRYCRSEDNPPSPLRISIEHRGGAENLLFEGNQLTTSLGNKNGTSLKISGAVGEGVPSTTVVCINNQFEGLVIYDTCNVISLGNTYQGEGGTTNGYILSGNQKNIKTSSIFLDNNIPLTVEELNITKLGGLNIIKESIVTGNEFPSLTYKSPNLNYGQYTNVVKNATQGAESSAHRFSQRFEGGFTTGSILFASKPPSTGEWLQGDRIFNSAPTSGSQKGWICTESGIPGTWIGEGTL